MPSALSLSLAATIKAPPSVYADDDDRSAAEWFLCPIGSYTTFISYTSIANHADKAYRKWRSIGEPRVTHEHTLERSLQEWVRTSSVEANLRPSPTAPGRSRVR